MTIDLVFGIFGFPMLDSMSAGVCYRLQRVMAQVVRYVDSAAVVRKTASFLKRHLLPVKPVLACRDYERLLG
ncbi:hypothetical protein [Pseudomonas sp. RA_35y_Pfl2_P32]|uniref:hypothetical protein n=1 Tax=Pseudomonas sp. RA_35y_Pfl2_P32 TaxID=3088705 RepID=UPI0030DCE502